MFLGEISIMLWFLIKGVRVRPLQVATSDPAFA